MPIRKTHVDLEWIGVRDRDRRTVVSVGNFDGLHIGHQRILRALVGRAKRDDAVSAAITFNPHPLKVLRPKTAPPLIMSLDQRLAGFKEFGLDAVLVVRFDEELAQLSAEEFVRTVLVEAARACAILVGANFRFGHRQAGDVALLGQLGKSYGFEVQIAPSAEVDGKLVSSSAIRQAVADGLVEEATALLGHPFALTGNIQPGDGRGSKIVFPTLNLAPEQELLPGKGVYATETTVEGERYFSVTNVGMRPTFGGTGLTIETHLLGFSDTVTAGSLEMRFMKRLREERKFSGPEALREQIAVDIVAARQFFQNLTVPTPPKNQA